MRISRPQTQKGFTLIELLVVVSIISLLSGIVMASLNTAKQKAQAAKTAQEAQSFKKAMELYRTGNQAFYAPAYYVPAYNSPLVNSGSDGALWNPFAAALKPYIDVNKLQFVTTGSSNWHYFGGAFAIDNNSYRYCGGVEVRRDGYLVMFFDPNSAGRFAKENTPGGRGTTGGTYNCFLSD